jgi:ribosomal protein L21E
MADTTDPIAAVRHYIDCFNKGDVVAMAATCDVPMSILDGMPPHVWHGPAAKQARKNNCTWAVTGV